MQNDALKMIGILTIVFGSWAFIGALNAHDINECVKSGKTKEECGRIFNP